MLPPELGSMTCRTLPKNLLHPYTMDVAVALPWERDRLSQNFLEGMSRTEDAAVLSDALKEIPPGNDMFGTKHLKPNTKRWMALNTLWEIQQADSRLATIDFTQQVCNRLWDPFSTRLIGTALLGGGSRTLSPLECFHNARVCDQTFSVMEVLLRAFIPQYEGSEVYKNRRRCLERRLRTFAWIENYLPVLNTPRDYPW
mgnify:CR=1 FL=1